MISATVVLLALVPMAAGETPLCDPPSDRDEVLLVMSAPDPALRTSRAAVERTVRTAAGDRLRFLPAGAGDEAATVESGGDERQNTLIKARAILTRAETRFRELDVDVALELIAKATAQLSSVHQEADAVTLLARAHLLAGAIFLARGRASAARHRIERALDLHPALAPERHLFSPRLLAEVAAVRAGQGVRPVGRLVVILVSPKGEEAQVHVDGRLRGKTPLAIDALPAGRHLLRVGTPGYRSFVTALRVPPNGQAEVRARLSPDAELAIIARLPGRLRAGEAVDDILDLLARRSGADQTLLAATVLGRRLTRAGTATTAVTLIIPGVGSAHAREVSPTAVGGALERVLACAQEAPGKEPAPAIIGRSRRLAPRLEPVPGPNPWWEASWFWAAVAVAAIGVSGGLVFARASGGPPDAVEVTLIPRP